MSPGFGNEEMQTAACKMMFLVVVLAGAVWDGFTPATAPNCTERSVAVAVCPGHTTEQYLMRSARSTGSTAPPSAGPPPSKEPPEFAKQVQPFLTQYCQSCHSAEKRQGGLSVDSFEALMEGGVSGPVVVPGKPDESWLVTLAEGKHEPVMPPRSALKKPKAGESAVLREWVAAGAAKDGVAPIARPALPPSVSALAYSRNGKFLAAGGYGEVFLLDAESHEVVGKIHGQVGKVTALAYNRSGSYLAVASGEPGRVGQIRIYFVPPSGIPAGKPEYFFRTHKDLIHELAFSPDGQTLASSSYDRTIHLWDFPPPPAGKDELPRPRAELKEHSDAVFGLAFSPDSQLLASAAADRTVKVWSVQTGKRLYTLGDATDGLYAVAWHPNGKQLAAAGIDKSIRIWDVTAEGGKLAHSVFAHEKGVIRLAYSSDGAMLYSLGEEHVAKAWETGRMAEKKAFAKQPETVLTLAVRPQSNQLSLGRHDGTLLVVDATTGKTLASPLPIKPKPPVVTRVTPEGAVPGAVAFVTIEGRNLEAVTHVELAGLPWVEWAYREGRPPAKGRLEIGLLIPEQTPPATYRLILKNAGGASEPVLFTVDRFPAVPERPPNNSLRNPQPVRLPVTLVGHIGRAGETDYYRFEAKAGDEVGVEVGGLPPSGAKPPLLEPVLAIFDAGGKLVAESFNGLLGFRCPSDGAYVLAIRDREYRGDAGFAYRLHVGSIPIIAAIYPLGLQRGKETEVFLEGVNLGGVKSVVMRAPQTAAVGSSVPILLNTPYGPARGGKSLVVGEFAEVHGKEVQPPQTLVIPVPGVANGRLAEGADAVWRFAAKKGERLVIEVAARQLGSPLDSFIEVLDADGKPVPRARLRCVAKTHVAFRDHDSAGAGIRLEAWNELAINDLIYVGGELLRIRALPQNPDDDCQFFSVGGRRQCLLDTSPTHHALGAPMYKVELHPPGAVFPANGMPVFDLAYCNDDGGGKYGKDSRLFFDPPTDGEYRVRIRNQQPLGKQAAWAAYRLTIRPPQPDFTIAFNPSAPAVWKGGGVPVQIVAERIDGFDGPIAVAWQNLPPGISAPPTTIAAGETATSVAMFADASAAEGPGRGGKPIQLIARAQIGGREVVREAAGQPPRLLNDADILAFTEQTEVVITPGGEARVTVRIERRNGFAGRVPIEVRGLPHGVRVLDIGLNGILITENEVSRTFVIYCEPWVAATEHPFVVLAKREGKNTDHAARSLLLKIVTEK